MFPSASTHPPCSPPKMERVRTLTMNWDALKDDDEDDRFFESFDATASSSDDDGFDDCRMSFASTVSSVPSSSSATSITPDYDVWMAAPGSIKERRKRLLQGMGLASDNDASTTAAAAIDATTTANNINNSPSDEPHHKQEPIADSPSHSPSPPPLPILLVRSRSDGDIETFSVDKQRKEEMIGAVVSKQRLTRTYSTISAPVRARLFPYAESIRVSTRDPQTGEAVRSTSRFGAFFLIKNLDTGKEFIVNEYGEDGMWNRFSDLQTGKQLTMEEFEKCVGYSPVVKELMRRENVSRINGHLGASDRKSSGSHRYITRSLRMSKRRGVALLKNGIRGVAHSMSGFICEKERDAPPSPVPRPDQKAGGKNSSTTFTTTTTSASASSSSSSSTSSGWMKVRQSGKSYKELSALHLCQEIQAHEGSIWTIKFSMDARFLASAGEDRIVHVWEVQECEVMSLRDEGNGTTPLHPSFCPSPEWPQSLADSPVMPSEKRKKGKGASSRIGSNPIPDYVYVPENVFALSDKPICSFKGHLDDVLDLSWSRSQLLLSSSMDKTVRLWDLESKNCLKLFAHNDYVTCIQFNPMNDDYFISGSLDAKVRIWSIPDRQVVDWTDLHEMVTAACYTPDGQGAFIGSHRGRCRMYSAEDCKLSQTSQIEFQTKKKSHAKKITGFQFSPTNPSEVLVTSADSRIRILDGTNPIHKFRGFRNTSSQISASFSQDGKYVISASEDSHVYVWKREEPRNSGSGKRSFINTRSYEQFQCKDVSVAIPWPGTIKGEPPSLPSHSKRHSKRSSSQPPSACGSPTREDISAAASKRQLPPLPKKGPAASASESSSNNIPPPEEQESGQVSRTESGIGESFNSDAASIRDGDSPSISAAAAAATPSSSWSWSSAWFDTSGSQSIQATAWGLVIVTAGLGGEIRAYQNFGLPRKVRQGSIFGGPT